eukprot:TRINITY_DN1669_c0_g1_i1.p1 TRINITY_DN1669_c0_g1~~TRINITY_DN1669_c0_g1_i1.p1  ORF type:complete len:423 (+),score=86.95 TRINITY_DN1669_c0_g1_i1:32-1270(+)
MEKKLWLLEELVREIRYDKGEEAFRKVVALSVYPDQSFGEVHKILEYIAQDRRLEILKKLHNEVYVKAELEGPDLGGILNRLKEGEGVNAVGILETRISPSAKWSDMGRVLEKITERDRINAVKTISRAISPSSKELLGIDEVAQLTQKIPDFVDEFVEILKPWIDNDLDISRIRPILDSARNITNRIEILCELVTHAKRSRNKLHCAEIRSILQTIPQKNAIKALKNIRHLISNDIDLNRIQLVYECIMKADQVKALAILVKKNEDQDVNLDLSTSISSPTQLLSVSDIKAVLETMEEPYQGLLLLRDRIDPDLQINKIHEILQVMKPINRIDTILLLFEIAKFEENQTTFSAFDMRSALRVMGTSAVEALRFLVVRFRKNSDRDIEQILECFSEAEKPTARTILLNSTST